MARRPSEVIGDEQAVRRAVDHVVANAARHATSMARVTMRRRRRGVALDVDDDGPGIPAGRRDDVVRRFVRLDEGRVRDGGGAGLGLAVAADVVDAHGGPLLINDSPLGGTRVTLTLADAVLVYPRATGAPVVTDSACGRYGMNGRLSSSAISSSYGMNGRLSARPRPPAERSPARPPDGSRRAVPRPAPDGRSRAHAAGWFSSSGATTICDGRLLTSSVAIAATATVTAAPATTRLSSESADLGWRMVAVVMSGASIRDVPNGPPDRRRVCRLDDTPPRTDLHRIVRRSPCERRPTGRRWARMTASTTVTTPNRVQRMMQHIASLRPVAAVFRHTFHHIDRWGLGISATAQQRHRRRAEHHAHHHRRQAGKQRTVPLVGVPVDGGRIAVVGTRWGSQHDPGWSYNLTADPRAVIERDGQHIEVMARRVLDRDEYDAIMRRADEVYVGFAKYRRRITRAPCRSSSWSASSPSPETSWGDERPDEASVDRCRGRVHRARQAGQDALPGHRRDDTGGEEPSSGRR